MHLLYARIANGIFQFQTNLIRIHQRRGNWVLFFVVFSARTSTDE